LLLADEVGRHEHVVDDAVEELRRTYRRTCPRRE
jgi:hypothetical protein